MISWLKRWLAKLLRASRPTPVRITRAKAAACASEADPRMGWAVEAEPSPEPPPQPDSPPLQNRAVRRAAASEWERKRKKLEKARIARDVLVNPKGELPERPKREPRPKKPKQEPPPPPPDPEPLPWRFGEPMTIADELIEGDGKGDVLFEETEFFGQFSFRDSILEQLERYFIYIERMRRCDPEAYGFYKEVGARLMPYSASGVNQKEHKQRVALGPKEVNNQLSPWFLKMRPGFGCIALGTDPLHEARERAGKKIYYPKFAYFQKLTAGPPPEVEHVTGGDVYSMTMWWDKVGDCANEFVRKYGTPQQFWIHVDGGGVVRALKTLIPAPPTAVARSSKHRIVTSKGVVRTVKRMSSHKMISRPSLIWGFPKDYGNWAVQHGATVEQYLRFLFVSYANRLDGVHSAVAQVTVKKKTAGESLAAVFSIDPRRLAYFFRDRDIEVTKGGARLRIFHWVKPFITKSGVAVKGHFRGSPQFSWAGYDVHVTIPGRDHILMDEFNVPTMDEIWAKKGEPMITVPQMGKELAKLVDGMPLSRLGEEWRGDSNGG
jgi:hypothetical protein